jgi:hypothetical protein
MQCHLGCVACSACVLCGLSPALASLGAAPQAAHKADF